jgi:peptide-methionine (R)-S-oxide reductase
MLFVLPVLLAGGCTAQHPSEATGPSFVNGNGEIIERIQFSEEGWKQRLSSEEYRVLRREGTERAFTGEFWDHHEQGLYICAGCALPLFESGTKFESGTGWPSFFAPHDETHVATREDHTFGMSRVEVHCNRCGGHLGHVFRDGPAPTGLRYCINSVSLDFATPSSD